MPAATRGDRSFGQEQLALLDVIDTSLLGRVTCRMFAGYWPQVTHGEERPFADRLNGTPKVVFSRTLDRAPWGAWDEAKVGRTARLRSGEAEATARHNMLIWGSISLVRPLMNEGLIDEYRLMVGPVVLESGRPLFSDEVASIDMSCSSPGRWTRSSVTDVPRNPRPAAGVG